MAGLGCGRLLCTVVAQDVRQVTRDAGKKIILPVLHAILKPMYKAHKTAIQVQIAALRSRCFCPVTAC